MCVASMPWAGGTGWASLNMLVETQGWVWSGPIYMHGPVRGVGGDLVLRLASRLSSGMLCFHEGRDESPSILDAGTTSCCRVPSLRLTRVFALASFHLCHCDGVYYGGRSTGLSSTLMGFLAIRLGPVLFLLPTHSSCTHFVIANRKGTHGWLQHMLFRLEHVKSNRYSALTQILCV